MVTGHPSEKVALKREIIRFNNGLIAAEAEESYFPFAIVPFIMILMRFQRVGIKILPRRWLNLILPISSKRQTI